MVSRNISSKKLLGWRPSLVGWRPLLLGTKNPLRQLFQSFGALSSLQGGNLPILLGNHCLQILDNLGTNGGWGSCSKLLYQLQLLLLSIRMPWHLLILSFHHCNVFVIPRLWNLKARMKRTNSPRELIKPVLKLHEIRMSQELQAAFMPGGASSQAKIRQTSVFANFSGMRRSQKSCCRTAHLASNGLNLKCGNSVAEAAFTGICLRKTHSRLKHVVVEKV